MHPPKARCLLTRRLPRTEYIWYKDGNVSCWRGTHLVYTVFTCVAAVFYVFAVGRLTRLNFDLARIEVQGNPFAWGLDRLKRDWHGPLSLQSSWHDIGAPRCSAPVCHLTLRLSGVMCSKIAFTVTAITTYGDPLTQARVNFVIGAVVRVAAFCSRAIANLSPARAAPADVLGVLEARPLLLAPRQSRSRCSHSHHLLVRSALAAR